MKKLELEEFVKRAIQVHGNKYDYSKAKYDGYFKKICIICPIHGEFWQTPHAHLNGHGCQLCSNNLKLNTKSFIEKAIEIHGNKYDYSKVEYINSQTKVCIICPKHGEFWQKPSCHLSMHQGCPKCKAEKTSNLCKSNTNDFIKKANEIHSGKYDYSKVEYVNSQIKVCIICPKHGEFWQRPNDHLNWKGCPKCNESKLESQIAKILTKNNINFIQNTNISVFNWLDKQHLDFYLPEYNVAIECQGGQHFKSVKHFGGDEKFKRRTELDKQKLKLCKENNIKLFYFSNCTNKETFLGEKLYLNENELLNAIINGTN